MTATAPRLDDIANGTIVTLDMVGTSVDNYLVKARDGQGDNRTITLTAKSPTGGCYDFDIYRYNGRWAYGSSAQAVKVVDVVASL